ncbi:alternative ribosome rescue factor ArfA [Atopomonas sediminilitoris]|uniref:alternative ribosome rescue factor ArfA n=1 Tax=Atopomonas sediminilitoris TaxID=2919919 RepID=UPI001F4D7068|nr:alternative ribosome rescue factor ArfA [Atopomonas sediminilitoris]MCJ8169757.1 ribosome alternative rescue factor ArfA [Atopomonas sediminilitoris]
MPPRRPSKAKAMVKQPCFRSRCEKPKKGRGSYQRHTDKASHDCEAFVFLAA